MFRAVSRVLFWTYSRGSWQYDILCGLIICFIFLTPASVFDGSAFRSGPKSPRVSPAPLSRPAAPTGEESDIDPAGRP